jgi:hypothetical protein
VKGEVLSISLPRGWMNKPPADAPGPSGWHHAYVGKDQNPLGSLGRRKKEEDTDAPLRDSSELDRPRH